MSKPTGTKIVISRCFGGFGLSVDARREYLTRAGKKWSERPGEFALLGPTFTVDGEDYWSERDLSRSDPVLVALVEERGSDWASGDHARLEVVELPAGTLYRIDEYDGNESVETRDAIDWSVA